MSDESDRGSITTGPISGAGIAIGHGARAEVHRHYPPPPPPQPKFIVPFPRNDHFVGRDDDLQRLHCALRQDEAVGVRPAMLSGMGGIGKTQLAVEYAYRFQNDYPGGVYWVNAAQDWQDELASSAEHVGLRADDAPESQRHYRLVMAFADFLDQHPDALIVFDNVDDPRILRTQAPGFIPAELKCRLLFTTRRRDPDLPFASIEVRVLPEMPALQLLLDTAARQEIWQQVQADINNANTTAARAICKSLGYLPLALALASSYLRKFPKVSLDGYLKRLETEGSLATVDAPGVDPLDLPTRHEAAVSSTLKSQWEALDNENARIVLQTAALLGEAAQIPRARLSLLTGLSDKSADGYPAPLDHSLIALHDLSLIEELTEHEIRLHPLIGQFAETTIPEPKKQTVYACLTRLARSLWDCARLHQEVAARGIDEVLDDLRTGIDIAVRFRVIGLGADATDELIRLISPLNLEAYHLRHWNPEEQPGFFLQQFLNRCLESGLEDLNSIAQDQLAKWRLSYLRKRFRASHESRELFYTVEAHDSIVNKAVFTPRGDLIISASADNSVKIWDFKSGRLIRTLEGHTDRVNGLAVTADGKFVVSASDDRSLRMWSIVTGQTVRILTGHTDKVNAVAITPDGRVVISASDDSTIRLWDTSTGQQIRALTGHRWAVTDIAITPDGKRLVSVSHDQTVKVWDYESGQVITTLQGHQEWINAVAVTPDSCLALSTSDDKTINVWDIDSGRLLRTLEGHSSRVTDVAIAPNGTEVASASEDGTVRLWNLNTGQTLRTLNGHAFGVTGVEASPDGRYLVSASIDTTLKTWDLVVEHVSEIPRGHLAPVHNVALAPDSQLTISASADNTLKLWDATGGDVTLTLQGHTDGINRVIVVPQDRRAVSASDDRTLNLWDIETGRILQTLRGHEGAVNDIGVTQDGLLMISASEDKTLKVWDLTSGQDITTLTDQAGPVKSVDFLSRDRIISGSTDGSLKVWALETGDVLDFVNGHDGAVNRIAISAQGDKILSASSDGKIRIWDVGLKSPSKTFEDNRGAVYDLAITPDSRFLVSVSGFETVKARDLLTGRTWTLLLNSPPLCCAITPDSKVIIIGDMLGAVHFFDWIRFEDK